MQSEAGTFVEMINLVVCISTFEESAGFKGRHAPCRLVYNRCFRQHAASQHNSKVVMGGIENFLSQLLKDKIFRYIAIQ